VEVDIATFARRRLGPAFVLHAYPSGKLESVSDGGAKPIAAETFGKAVTYAAQILDDQNWTCEFRIPVASLGVDPSDLKSLRFNLGLRRNGAAGGPWFAAVNTHGANYELADGAVLQLDPRVHADAPNLLTKGRFEDEDLSPWRISTNGKDPVPEQTVQRVVKGRRGDGCAQLQANDAEAMKQRVFKWTYPLPDTVVAPGVYCLSYEVRILERLKPRGSMGSFNSYLHIQKNGKAGGNLGQNKAMLLDTGGGWLRRDFVIEIPANVKPSMISLQLHHATGIVLLDNVSLIRCQE
jgi:hypothetical protein